MTIVRTRSPRLPQDFIGIDEDDRLPFRAYLLTDPVRVVVEVRHD